MSVWLLRVSPVSRMLRVSRPLLRGGTPHRVVPAPPTALLIVLMASLLAACSAPHLGAAPSATPTVAAHPAATVGPTPPSVYLTSDPDQVTALDAATGALRWNVHTSEQPLRPLLAQGVVYFASEAATSPVAGTSYVTAIRASDGALLWRHTLGDFIFNPNTDEALAYANGVVYISAQTNIYALRASDGGQLWKATLPEDTAPPVVGNNVLYTLVWDDAVSQTLYALDATTGAIQWHSATLSGDDNEPRAPLLGDGFIFADTGVGLYTLSATDGSIRWDVAGFTGPSLTPALVNGVLYDGGSGVSAYQPAMGESVWSNPPMPHINFALVADASGVYTSSPDGYVALDPATGQQKWTVPFSDQSYFVPLALAEGTLYTVIDRSVMALHTVDGSTIWTASLPGQVTSATAPAVG